MDTSAYVDRCLQELQRCAQQLGGDASSPTWPRLAQMVIQSMTGPWRSFHTPEHIFEVGQDGSPIEVLAALFHDLVYVQVDHGINLGLSRYLAHCLRETDKGLSLDVGGQAHDQGLRMTMDLFGMQDGQLLNPFAGQNEFLSALVAVQAMRELLPLSALARIAVCIEATIPFRRIAEDGRSCSDTLHARLQQANLRYQLGLDTQALQESIEAGVRIANRDIGNFASSHPAAFLDNTWNLIPETNHDLLQVNVYTIRGYRISLQKMEGFLGSLQPEAVFRQYGQEPDPQTHAQRLALTTRNLQVARLYLRVKLVAIGLLEALSLRIGQDVSLASMMGGRHHGEGAGMQLENLLPAVAAPHLPRDENERITLQLLQTGRTSESPHDTRHSPLSSYLVQALGFADTLDLLSDVNAFFASPTQAQALLARLPQEVYQSILNGVHAMFAQRTQAFAH